MLKNKKLVIFDMDGCLVDSENIYTMIWGKVFEMNDIPITEDEIKKWRGLGWGRIKGIITEITKSDDITMDLRAQREAMFYDCLEKGQIYLKPYALEIIHHLRDNNYYIALGTSTYEEKASVILKHFGLYQYFDKVIYGDSVKNTKPSPEIYLKIYEAFDVEKHETLIFEDSGSGIKAANNAGIDVIYVPDGDMIELKDLKVLKVIESFNEVM